LAALLSASEDGNFLLLPFMTIAQRFNAGKTVGYEDIQVPPGTKETQALSYFQREAI
jgi:hypothetical protein